MSPAAAPGRVLGDRYRLVSPIARGGMASVWVGDDVLLSRRVAVKTLHPELALDDGLRARFRREAIAAAKLGHPDIVAHLRHRRGRRRRLHRHGARRRAHAAHAARRPRARCRCRRRCASPAKWRPRSTTRTATASCTATSSPRTSSSPPKGPVKVTDFGIAKATGASDLTRTGTVVGTARYLAPEQVEGGTSDARTDVYAVGLLLYEMLVGRLPFGGDTEMAAAIARVTAAAPAVRTSRPEVTPEVDALVARCLERDPDQRFQDAAELAAALDAAGAAGGTPLAPPLHAGAPAPRRSSADADSSYDTVPRRRTPPRRPPSPPVRPRPTRVVRGRRSSAPHPAAGAGPGSSRSSCSRCSCSARPATSSPVGSTTATAPAAARPATAPPATAVQIVSAKDFDPFGTEGEHPEAVDRAIDGKPDTFWYTQTYDSPTMAKPGVGLYVVLDRTTDVRTVDVETDKAGWNAAIYVADSPGTSLAQWGQPLAQGTDLGTHAHFTLEPATSGKAVLLWLTKLPSAAKGYALEVNEVRVG